MNSRCAKLLCCMVLLLAGGRAWADDATNSLVLWYDRPAETWTNALPIGNGRLGAMVFGGIEREHLQLNEGTLWGGGPYNPNNTNAFAALAKVRQLIFAGQNDAADQLISDKMMAKPLREMPYETAGDLYLDCPLPGATDYRRDLDLNTATAHVTFSSGGVKYTREIFASAVDQVVVIHLTADRPGKISFTAALQTPQTAAVSVEVDTNGNFVGVTNDATLVMTGTNGEAHGIAGALRFEERVRVAPSQGQIVAGANSIKVTGANDATILIAIATSYKNYQNVTGDPAAITKQQIKRAYLEWWRGGVVDGADTTLADHIADYRRLFGRVALNLGTNAESEKLPTDQRIARFSEGQDPQLAALYFQFARYLLISSSRAGGQPATLQGLWNNSMTPPWESKYTININTEMNYWPAEAGNLSECVEPLTAMVMDLTQTGARTARTEYHARGWVAHHNTDLWRAAAPVDKPAAGMWPMGGAWLCQNLWEHFLFAEDTNYLRRIYPAMKGAAQFFFDTLVQDPTNHWLVTCPSLSPENRYPGAKTAVCAGPTMDLEILRDLFSHCIRATEILNRDHDFAKQCAATNSRLAPLQIGSAGQLQEWLQDVDLQSHDPHHRHVSHLYGLYPSGQIDLRTTPNLAAAAKKSLEIRGDQATGWATAWRINLWARLHDGDHAYRILEYLLSPQRTYPDMFDSCPPFQIDGNFGGAAGIAEMLLQSQNGTIEFLPALPRAWPTGSVSGLRARGGFVIDMAWENQKLTAAAVHSLTGTACHLRYGNNERNLTLKKGDTAQLNGRLQ